MAKAKKKKTKKKKVIALRKKIRPTKKKKLVQKKSAIVVSFKPSKWGSCQIITPNLQKAVCDALEGHHTLFGYTGDDTSVDILKTARQILKSSPDKIIFIDHVPHPLPLLQALSFLNNERPLPPLIFHVYGDFTLYPSQWISCEKILKRTKVHFICASHRQELLVSGFLKTKTTTSVCPFPVDPSQYYFSEELRRHGRKVWGLADDEFALLYTGRISAQKNVLRLTREVEKAMKENPKLHFFLAGNFDNISAPFFGHRSPVGEYLKQWLNQLNSIDQSIRSRIHYLGQVGSKELLQYYNAADLFLSLSTHHDEDYGMSPIEGLFCGCPAMLSSWGGYASFNVDKKSVKLIPIKPTATGLQISSQKIQEAIRYFATQSNPLDLRKSRAQLFLSKFSIGAAQKVLSKTYSSKKLKKFTDFSELFRIYNVRYESYKLGFPLYPEGATNKGLYFKIYRNYMGR